MHVIPEIACREPAIVGNVPWTGKAVMHPIWAVSRVSEDVNNKSGLPGFDVHLINAQIISFRFLR